MMTRRMQRMMQKKQGAQQEGAPRQAMLMGEPHMLAYINEAERQMLKRAGGAEAPGPKGIPVYGFWGDVWSEITSGGKANTETFNGSSSNSNSGGVDTSFADDVLSNTSNYLPGASNDSNNDNVNDYNQFQSVYNNQVVDAQQNPTNMSTATGSTNGGGVDTSFADAVLANPENFLPGASNDSDGNGINDYDEFQAVYNTQLVDAEQNPTGMSTADGVYTGDSYGGTGTGTGTGTSTTTTTGGGGTSVVTAPPVNQALLDAQARRAAALAKQMGAVATAFGFSTDDYYNQLGTDYREGGLSEAFTTAYDDAIRGIYDVYKSAGMLTQSDVDDDLGILAGANSGEEGRMDSIVDQYTTANRNYVTEGRGGIEGELQGFVTDTEDIPTIDAQTAQILAYDVPGKSQPYKTPQEAEVVEFFTDFVKRAYDPSYNVDPTAVASGGPKKVSGSVDQLGAGTQPSTIAGILDPVKGGSVKVVG
jgi:hypothetical protein